MLIECPLKPNQAKSALCVTLEMHLKSALSAVKHYSSSSGDCTNKTRYKM